MTLAQQATAIAATATPIRAKIADLNAWALDAQPDYEPATWDERGRADDVIADLNRALALIASAAEKLAA